MPILSEEYNASKPNFKTSQHNQDEGGKATD